MAFHPHQAIYVPLIDSVRDLARLMISRDGTIERVYFKSDNINSNGNAVFDIKINGVSIYAAPEDRPVILINTKPVLQVDLGIAVATGDIMTYHIVNVPVGGIGGRLYMQVEVDDGIPTAGPPGEDGEDGAPGLPGAPGADGIGLPPCGTTGQVPKKQSNDDYDIAWEDETVGGGGGTSGWHPDEPPSSPTSYDDEFPGSSLDGKWSVLVNDVSPSGGSIVASVKEHSYVIDLVGSGSSPFSSTHIIQQNVPSTPYTFRCKAAFQMPNNPARTGDLFFGLYETTGKSVVIGQEQLGAVNQALELTSSRGTALSNPRATVIMTSRVGHQVMYFEIENTGTNIIFRYSYDGRAFSRWGTVSVATAFTTAPTKLIIGGRVWVQTADHGTCGFDWVRRIS